MMTLRALRLRLNMDAAVGVATSEISDAGGPPYAIYAAS